MKKISVVVLVVVSLAFGGFAEAAKAKKRTRNANRVGAYGSVLVGMTRYTGDASQNEAQLLDVLATAEVPFQNLSASTKDTDLGYHAAFGFRFTRFFAAELGLVQYGELASTARGQLDFGNGFEDSSVKLAFNVGGPVLSAIGILPLSEKFEFYGRVGYLFASSERQFSSRVSGVSGVAGSAKGDSQNVVYGVGASYNINQVYSIRGEYQKISNVGQASRTGTEDLDVLALGLSVRF